MNKLAIVLTGLAVGLAGCVEKQDATAPAQQPPASPLEGDGTAQGRLFEDKLLEIAASYESYGRIDAAARWAPTYCRARVVGPATPTFSRSEDTDTHGQKLYSLFAKEHSPLGSYTLKGQPSPVGQVVVKESWVPEEVKDEGTPLKPLTRKVQVRSGDRLVEQEDSFLPYTRKDGHLYHAKEKGPLFVMFKTEPGTPSTDEGWVYGTVTADGKAVTSAGRVESCMKCHQDAPHDRLFGLPE
jgi:hypothetical protein